MTGSLPASPRSGTRGSNEYPLIMVAARLGSGLGCPACLAFALTAANHALAMEMIVRLRHHDSLAGRLPIVEADSDPVARQAESMGQRYVRERGNQVPVAALRRHYQGRGAAVGLVRKEKTKSTTCLLAKLLVDGQQIGDRRLEGLRDNLVPGSSLQGIEQAAKPLWPELQKVQPALAGRTVDFFDGVDSEVVPQSHGQSRTDPGKARKLIPSGAGSVLRAQRAELAGSKKFLEGVGKMIANTWQAGERVVTALVPHLFERLCQPADGRCGLAIGADPVETVSATF